MDVNLASVEELRCDLQALRERIAEQVSQSERSLHKYVQLELVKAQSYLKNVSEKLTAHIERDGRTDGEDRLRFKDPPARREEGSPSSSEGNSSHQPEGGAKAARLDSDTKRLPPKQKLTEANGCPPTSKKMSRCDEGRGRGSNRSFVDGTNQASKVPGKSLLQKCAENGQTPRMHSNGKTSRVNHKAAPKAADVDKVPGGRRQDLNRQQLNHMEPKSRGTNPKRHSAEPECREKVNTAKFVTVRVPLSVNTSNNTNYTNVKTRFLRRHQDDEVRALFGL